MQIEVFVLENTHIKFPPECGLSVGWGNGYVGVPEGHPWFGKDYAEIEGVDINGGLTYSENHKPKHKPDGLWWVGFDTMHVGDDRYRWPDRSSVLEETNRLKSQAEKLC